MHLLIDAQLTAAENMRRDEALLSRALPAVRLYGWSPEAVSLGNSQTVADIDEAAARDYQLDIVKRGTGGGGILHNASEVTYAVVVPIDHPQLPRALPASFALLGAGVLAALRALGVPAELESVPDLTREALCYVRKQGTNLVVAGKKISGGAQRRTRAAVLQHGTVIVDRDEARLARVFRTDAATVVERVTSLRELGNQATRADITAALVTGFAEALASFGPLVPATWDPTWDVIAS
jgi:lipoate-protein ligase A